MITCVLPFYHLAKSAEEASAALKAFGIQLKFHDYIYRRECPNRKVAHLALHAKKARTRKKNIKRVFKYMEKEKKV